MNRTRPARRSSASRPVRSAYKRVDRVDVWLWGERIGACALDPTTGLYAFRFTDEFRASGIEPAPLMMSARPARTYVFDLPRQTFRRLPAMLSDALPDDFGNALIDAFLADHGIRSEQITPLDRLAYMGSRAMGALEFKPERGAIRHGSTAIELGTLVEQARLALRGDVKPREAGHTLRALIDVGTSAGGARAKAVIALNRQTREIRSGQFDAPAGFEHWLLKFDGVGADRELGVTQGYGRIEYAYHLMARDAGIDMMECDLLEEDGRAHFMTRRFDRDGPGTRHHLQSLCAIAHLDYRLKATHSYAQLFEVAERLGLSYAEREEAFRRTAFNVLAFNCDDHTKNVAFLLRRGSRWSLAPAYDITFAHNPMGEWTHQHLMSVNGRFKDIEDGDLLALADRAGIGTARRVLEQVRCAIAQWPTYADMAGVGPAPRAAIASLLS